MQQLINYGLSPSRRRAAQRPSLLTGLGAGHLVPASVSADASEGHGGSWDARTTGSAWPASPSGCRGSGSVGAGGSFPRMDGLPADHRHPPRGPGKRGFGGPQGLSSDASEDSCPLPTELSHIDRCSLSPRFALRGFLGAFQNISIPQCQPGSQDMLSSR